MNHFMPSKKILDEICWDEKLPKQYTHIGPPYNDPWLVSYCVSLCYQIPKFYMIQYRKCFNLLPGQENFDAQRLSAVVMDALNNCYGHGNANEKGLAHLLLMGEKGICNGFLDGGDFFKREDIKEKFESKIHPKELNRSIKVKGAGGGRFGLLNIFRSSDIIEVGTEEGALYCVQYIDKMFRDR